MNISNCIAPTRSNYVTQYTNTVQGFLQNFGGGSDNIGFFCICYMCM